MTETITRREFLQAAAAAGAVLATSPMAWATTEPARDRPNILLIVADDLGLQLGCYGDPNARTGRIDELAAGGVRFTRAYVTQPSCSPSRASILTGQYPHENGQIGLSHQGFGMKGEIATLPTLLKAAGYRTGLLGKLHVAPQNRFTWDMWEGGFDGGVKWPDSTRDVRRTAARAETFFKASAKPFFLQISMLDPHEPLLDDHMGLPQTKVEAGTLKDLPSVEAGQDPQALRRRWASYYNCVHRLDAGVGLVLDALKASGKDRDTLVVFVGDNGPPFRRAKTTLYEAGTRTPLIIAGPGTRPAATREELVSTIDIMPTVLAAAGLRPPGGDGRSLLEACAGRPVAESWRTCVFTEMTFHTPAIFRPSRAVSDGRWKMIVSYPGTPDQAMTTELFDLAADPHELHNLADQETAAGHRKRLQQALDDWQRRTGDGVLVASTLAEWRRKHQQGLEAARKRANKDESH